MLFEYVEIWSDGVKSWPRRHRFECDSKKHPTYRFIKQANKSKKRFKGLDAVSGDAEYFVSQLREIRNV